MKVSGLAYLRALHSRTIIIITVPMHHRRRRQRSFESESRIEQNHNRVN